VIRCGTQNDGERHPKLGLLTVHAARDGKAIGPRSFGTPSRCFDRKFHATKFVPLTANLNDWFLRAARELAESLLLCADTEVACQVWVAEHPSP